MYPRKPQNIHLMTYTKVLYAIGIGRVTSPPGLHLEWRTKCMLYIADATWLGQIPKAALFGGLSACVRTDFNLDIKAVEMILMTGLGWF